VQQFNLINMARETETGIIGIEGVKSH